MKLVIAALLTLAQLGSGVAFASPTALAVAGSSAAAPIDESKIRAALISPIADDSLRDEILPATAGQMAGDELEVVYDAAQFKTVASKPVTLAELERLSAEMASDQYVDALASTILIPSSTPSASDLKNLRGIKPADLAAFIAKKNAFLEKIASVLSIVRLDPASINRVLGLVNEQFFKRADAILHANSQTGSIGIGVGGGLGIPDWLTKQLRKSALFAGMPDHAGFFFGFSLGLAIVHTTENGKSRLRIEPYVDFRHATKIMGPFAYVGGSVSVGMSLDRVNQDPVSHGNFFNISRVGFSWTDHGTGIGTGLIGASFPPMGSRFAVIQGQSVGFRANADGVRQLGAYLKEFFRPADRRGGAVTRAPRSAHKQCRDLLLGAR